MNETLQKYVTLTKILSFQTHLQAYLLLLVDATLKFQKMRRCWQPRFKPIKKKSYNCLNCFKIFITYLLLFLFFIIRFCHFLSLRPIVYSCELILSHSILFLLFSLSYSHFTYTLSEKETLIKNKEKWRKFSLLCRLIANVEKYFISTHFRPTLSFLFLFCLVFYCVSSLLLTVCTSSSFPALFFLSFVLLFSIQLCSN